VYSVYVSKWGRRMNEMRRASISLVAVGLALGALCASGFAQVELKNDPSYPLQLVSVSSLQFSEDGTVFHGATVSVQNMGSVPCVAFAVSLVLELSNSQTRRMTFSEDHNALAYAKGSSSDEIVPGQTYIMRDTTGVRLPIPIGVTITEIQARVVYVETADGKSYGDDRDKVGPSFRIGRLERAAERARLLKIYNTQGLQALLDELQR
jgi:hypothetical protein